MKVQGHTPKQPDKVKINFICVPTVKMVFHKIQLLGDFFKKKAMLRPLKKLLNQLVQVQLQKVRPARCPFSSSNQAEALNVSERTDKGSMQRVSSHLQTKGQHNTDKTVILMVQWTRTRPVDAALSKRFSSVFLRALILAGSVCD